MHTAVWKRPVEGPRLVRRLDIDGSGPVVLQHAGCGQDINDVWEWHVPAVSCRTDQLTGPWTAVRIRRPR
jgi:hypothetical protein